MPVANVEQKKIMISSTRSDLKQYREAASQVIKKVAHEFEKEIQLVEISMEKETQTGEREFAVDISRQWVETADWVILIVGWNYGTISDQSETAGLSITEWEYRHAMKLEKKIFVFMAGRPKTANQYRVSEEEVEDLKDWIPKQTKEQLQKLEHFKNELEQRHAEMFSNLQAFRERLEKTLKDRIYSLPPDIPPGSPLADLIVELTPSIRDCIRKVTVIANCKAIHDRLHELRQQVVRPLREEVLAIWKQEGLLSPSHERIIFRCINKASRQLGGISEAINAIGPEHKCLRDCTHTLLQGPELWDMENDMSEPQMEQPEFAELLDRFADDVQEAFSEADRSMIQEEDELRELYVHMLSGLKKGRSQKNLSEEDQARLDEELLKIERNRSAVRYSLATHHRWQETHDKLEEVESHRESRHFERKLDHYRGTPLSKLLELVNEEIERTNTHVILDSGKEQILVSIDIAPEPGQVAMPDMERDHFINTLMLLKNDIEELGKEAAIETFDNMRKPFDDAFYIVDKRTLRVVKGSRERVLNIEKWLDELSATAKKTVEFT